MSSEIKLSDRVDVEAADEAFDFSRGDQASQNDI
jgi:hypothetical protein